MPTPSDTQIVSNPASMFKDVDIVYEPHAYRDAQIEKGADVCMKVMPKGGSNCTVYRQPDGVSLGIIVLRQKGLLEHEYLPIPFAALYQTVVDKAQFAEQQPP